jgi:hypothetical protein
MMQALQTLRALMPVRHQQHGDTERMPDLKVMIRIPDEQRASRTSRYRSILMSGSPRGSSRKLMVSMAWGTSYSSVAGHGCPIKASKLSPRIAEKLRGVRTALASAPSDSG